MDWTRMFEYSPDGSSFGLVFVEVNTWLLRKCSFPDKYARSLVEVIEWLRTFVRRTVLVGRHSSLDTELGAYCESVRRLFASRLDFPASSALVVDDPSPGVPIALVPTLSADQEHVLVL